MNNVSIFSLKTCKVLSRISLTVGFQVKLHFTDAALRIIAQKAMCKNTGARGLRTILENILMDSMYEVRPMSTLYSSLELTDKLNAADIQTLYS